MTANRNELKSPLIARLAQRHGCTPAEVVFRFALGVGMLPLTGTSNPEHMRRDLACKDFELSAEEIAAVERVAG